MKIKIFSFFLLISSVVFAESIVYITEKLEIPLRTGQDFSSNIIRMLVTGTKMTLLERSQQGWVKVKVGADTGWVTSHYITNDEPAYKKLLSLEGQYEKINKKHTQQKEELKKVKESLISYKNEQSKLKLENSKLEKETNYMESTYKDSLSLGNENQKLLQKNLVLRSEIKLLNQNSKGNGDQSSKNWFMVGGFVLFLGVILGAILLKIFTAKPRNNHF